MVGCFANPPYFYPPYAFELNLLIKGAALFKRLFCTIGMILFFGMAHCLASEKIEINIHRLILHNNLLDVDYLHRNFGLKINGFYFEGEAGRYLADIETSPDEIYGSNLSFYIQNIDNGTHVVRLKFRLKRCGDLNYFNGKLTLNRDLLGNAAGVSARTVGRGDHDVMFQYLYFFGSDERCYVELSQSNRSNLDLKDFMRSGFSHDVSGYLKELAKGVSGGDLSNYLAFSDRFGFRISTSGLMIGDVSLNKALPGIDGSKFKYFINNLGWEKEVLTGGRAPRYELMVNKMAELSVEFYRGVECVFISNLDEIFGAKFDADGRARLFFNNNSIDVFAMERGGCVGSVAFKQKSDYRDNFDVPMILDLNSSDGFYISKDLSSSLMAVYERLRSECGKKLVKIDLHIDDDLPYKKRDHYLSLVASQESVRKFFNGIGLSSDEVELAEVHVGRHAGDFAALKVTPIRKCCECLNNN